MTQAPVALQAAVDPALFRLREFEAQWLEPLKAPLFLEADALTLKLVLVAEAERWHSWGQQVGYFAQPDGEPSLDPGDEFNDYLGAAELPEDLDVPMFARELSYAREDLTPERRELLRLVFFAGEFEWSVRVAELSELLRRLTARPCLSLQLDTVDTLAWSFQLDTVENVASLSGALLGKITDAPRLPADWRMGKLAAAAHRKAPDRLTTLQEAQRAIAAAAEWIAEDERTSAQLQIAAKLQSREARESSAVERDQITYRRPQT